MNRAAVGAAVAAFVVVVGAVVAIALSDDGRSGDTAGGGFCDAVEAYDQAAAEADVSANVVSDAGAARTDRAEERTRLAVRAAVGRLRVAVVSLERHAPEVVDADVELAMAADRRYFEALDDADYDLFALLGDPRVEVTEEELAAATRVEEYTQLECRVSLRPVVFNASADVPSGANFPTEPGDPAPLGPIPPGGPRDPRQPPTAGPEPAPVPVAPSPPPDFGS